jgi:hypothetical protein
MKIKRDARIVSPGADGRLAPQAGDPREMIAELLEDDDSTILLVVAQRGEEIVGFSQGLPSPEVLEILEGAVARYRKAVAELQRRGPHSERN